MKLRLCNIGAMQYIFPGHLKYSVYASIIKMSREILIHRTFKRFKTLRIAHTNHHVMVLLLLLLLFQLTLALSFRVKMREHAMLMNQQDFIVHAFLDIQATFVKVRKRLIYVC